VDVGGPHRNQKRTAHAERSLASKCNFLVDVTVGLSAQSRRVEDERVVRCREFVANPLIPILSPDQSFFVEPGLEAGAVESFEKPGGKRTVFASIADENARTGTERRRLRNNSAFSLQPMGEFSKKFADVGVFQPRCACRAGRTVSSALGRFRTDRVAIRQRWRWQFGAARGSAPALSSKRAGTTG